MPKTKSTQTLRVGDEVLSPFFQDFIKVSRIESNDKWWFTLKGKEMQAHSPLSFYTNNSFVIKRKRGRPRKTQAAKEPLYFPLPEPNRWWDYAIVGALIVTIGIFVIMVINSLPNTY